MNVKTLTPLSQFFENERETLQKLFKEFFQKDYDLYELFLSVKEGKKRSLGRFDYSPSDITEDTMIGVYAEVFGKESVLHDCYPEGAMTENIFKQQDRPRTGYLFSHYGNPLPDLLDKNFEDIKNAGHVLMILKEGIMAAFRRRLESSEPSEVGGIRKGGEVLDLSGSTYFFALDKNKNLIRMSGYNSFFSIRNCDACNKGPKSGFRQVMLY